MNFFEEDNYNAKIIEFAQKILEKNENDIIIDTKYEDHLSPVEIGLKGKEIHEIILKIKSELQPGKSKVYISEENYKILKDLAISKGGFLNMKYRREIYKILLFFNEEELSPKFILDKNTNKIDKKNYIPSFQFFKNIWINQDTADLYWKNEYLNQELIYSKDHSVVKADTIRSDINHYFPSDKYPYINSLLKQRLESGLNILINFNNSELKYFQGYHDIFILFFYLYLDSPYTYLSLFQRFSELYIKENLLLQSKSNKGYTFPNSIKFCLTLIKQLNSYVYQDLVDYCNSECIFIIPYIVSLFTHNIENLNKRYRIIDYLMVSNPINVYIMSAVIVVDEVLKLKAEYNIKKFKNSAFSFFGGDSGDKVEPLNVTDFYVRFQNLDLDKYNFDELILKTENEIKKINFDAIRKEFLGEPYLYEKFYPTMYQGQYLKDLIASDNKENNKVINKELKDKSEEPFYNFLIKLYDNIYGKRNEVNKSILKKNYFNSGVLLLLSLFTLYFAYFLFEIFNLELLHKE